LSSIRSASHSGWVLCILLVSTITACGGAGSLSHPSAGDPSIPPAVHVSVPPQVPSTGLDSCPSEMPLEPGFGASTGVHESVAANVPSIYANLDTTGYVIARVYPAAPTAGLGAIPFGLCGTLVGSRTWVAELYFPRELPSADLSQGQLFLSRFASGWRPWMRYH
jgi:hypothetical protein